MFKKLAMVFFVFLLNLLFGNIVFAQNVTVTSYDQWLSTMNASINNLEESICISIKDFDKDIYNINKLDYHNISISSEGTIASNTATIEYQFKYIQNFKLIRAAQNPNLISRLDKNELRLYNYAKAITKTLTESAKSDYEKTLRIHNYIVLGTKYDEVNFKKGTIPESSFTIRGLLYDGIAVCQAYAATFQLMSVFSNVNCQTVTGTVNKQLHDWNIVRLDGEYYHIDTTSDDPVPDRKGRIYYKYFNLPDTEIAKTHIWDRSKYPVCNSTKYNYYIYNEMVVSSFSELEKYLNAKLASKPMEVQFYTKGFSVKSAKEISFVFKTGKLKSYTLTGEIGVEGPYVFTPVYN